MVEIVLRNPGRADARLLTFSGHPSIGWDPQDDDQVILTATEYRRLAAQVDAALASASGPTATPDVGEIVVCTDGPGFVTERVRNGAVVHLVGSCSPVATENHPNLVIAAAIQDMLCRHRESASRQIYWSGRRCFAPLLTMAQWQTERARR